MDPEIRAQGLINAVFIKLELDDFARSRVIDALSRRYGETRAVTISGVDEARANPQAGDPIGGNGFTVGGRA